MPKGTFSIADVNIIQGQVNNQDFLAAVLTDISKQPPTAATTGADREATKSKAQADHLREYQALVRRLS